MTSEAEFMDGLRKHFDATEWCLIPQVRNGTGFDRQTRTADALAVSLWPSRGIDAWGFEFKDSRTDWLKELKQPEKSEEIGRYCAFWWLVVSDAAIVAKSELPSAWGLMVLGAERGVKVITKAPRREAQQPTWSFTAAVLRAAVEVVTDEVAVQKRIQVAVNKANDGVYHRIEEAKKIGQEAGGKEYRNVLARIAAFEEASGVKIDRYSDGANRRIGEAVKIVMEQKEVDTRSWLERVVSQCDHVKEHAAKALAELSSVEEPAP